MRGQMKEKRRKERERKKSGMIYLSQFLSSCLGGTAVSNTHTLTHTHTNTHQTAYSADG